MTERSLSFSKALAVAWGVIKQYPALAIGGFLLYFLISAGLNSLPIIGFFTQILLAPPLTGGITILTLNLIDRRNPKIADLFDGFTSYGKWMGVYWLWTAISLGIMLPAGIVGVGAYALFTLNPPFLSQEMSVALAGVLSLITVAALAAAIAIVMRWSLLYYAAAESNGALEAFAKSSQITKGHRLHLFWLFIAFSFVAAAGLLALLVGVIVTLPLFMIGIAACYRQLEPLPETLSVTAEYLPDGTAPPPFQTPSAPHIIIDPQQLSGEHSSEPPDV